jgi:RNA polymerase I-specific transcription initiation factor RRN6
MSKYVYMSNLLRLELAESDVTVPDVDGTSAQLEDLFSRTDLWNLRRIASQQALHLADADEETPTISSIYDTILQSWIAPLPTSIPTRVRQSKEQLTRRIAAETVLASSRIRIANDGRASLSALTLGDIAPQPNPMSRLSQHLEITKPLPEVSPNVRQVLMHWTLATHPGSYDWNTTTRTVDEELGINEDDETPSQKDKERLKRKAERLLKRQKRESEIGKRITESQPLGVGEMLPMMSSPVPMVRWDMSSQPQHASQTQSQAESQSQGFPGFVQSQVEPGRHGARPAVKKKKKGRVSGF